MIDGRSEPYCFDWNRNGGGVLIHIREDKPSNLLAVHKLLHGIEEIFVELNLRKKKWLIFGSHNPLSQSDDYFFHQVKKSWYVWQILWKIYADRKIYTS